MYVNVFIYLYDKSILLEVKNYGVIDIILIWLILCKIVMMC